MLLEFYGRECPPCMTIRPLLEKIEKEKGVKIKKYEVWHDDDNAKLLQKYAKDKCLGVPFLLNTKTEDFVCGLDDYERLREWAGVKK